MLEIIVGLIISVFLIIILEYIFNKHDLKKKHKEEYIEKKSKLRFKYADELYNILNNHQNLCWKNIDSDVLVKYKNDNNIVVRYSVNIDDIKY